MPLSPDDLPAHLRDRVAAALARDIEADRAAGRTSSARSTATRPTGKRARFTCPRCPELGQIVGQAAAQRHADDVHGGGRLECVLE